MVLALIPRGNCTGLVPKVTVQLLHSCVFQRCNVLSFPKEKPCQRSSAVCTFFCPLSSARRSLCVTSSLAMSSRLPQPASFDLREPRSAWYNSSRGGTQWQTCLV